MSDEGKLADADTLPVVTLSRKDRNTIALNGIFILGVLLAVYFAASLLLPIVIAILISMLCDPVVRQATRIGIPEPVSAAVIVLTLVVVMGATVFWLSGPAQDWFEKIPRNLFRVEQKLNALKRPLAQIQSATKTLESAGSVEESKPLEVRIERPGIVQQMLTGTPRVLTSIGMVVLMVYLLLASGDAFLRKLVAVSPAFEDKKRAVEITRSIQTDIAIYLGALTLLNFLTGSVVALVCWLLTIPHPLLWGVMTMVLSFAPYAGSAVIFGLLTFVGLLTFDSWTWAMLPALVYLAAMILNGNVIIPLVVGKRLTLNPLAIFLSIIFWGWMWGVVGALVAVPLLASMKIICERIEPLQPAAEFLTP
jgi:predicted PurR-regulated permease PerM